MIWTPVSTSVTLPSHQTQSSWVFLVAVAETSESAQSNYNTGLELIATGDLCPSHMRSWTELWLGSTVEVVGPETLNRALIGCMFYLLSAFPSLDESAEPFGGVSPGGLSNGGKGEDYLGHVFWDQVNHTGALLENITFRSNMLLKKYSYPTTPTLIEAIRLYKTIT